MDTAVAMKFSLMTCFVATYHLVFVAFSFVSVFRCLRKIRPPTRNNCSHGKGFFFIKFDTEYFRKPVEKIQVPLKSGRTNGYYTDGA